MTKQNKLKVFIETYGCQMNVADSETLSGLLTERGFEIGKKPEDSDLVVINTCSVRERAERRAKAHIKEYCDIKKKYRRIRSVWVTGCMAQRLGNSLKKEIPGIDAVIGAEKLEYIPEFIDSVLSESGLNTQFYPEKLNSTTVSGFLPVMRGCNNFCSYCIVPYVRGKEHSISENILMEKVKKMSEAGIKEITLLGQNVNSYNDGKNDFSDLISRLHDFQGIERIRFMTSHPKDLSDKLIMTIAELPKVCRHVHLPVQSGSSKILKLMNRGYARNDYLHLIEKIKKYINDVDITTDVMTGFPGESDNDFNDTVKLFREVEFTSAFMFVYSKRSGTKAAEMKHQIDYSLKKQRLEELIEIQTEITRSHYAKCKGSLRNVLVDRCKTRDGKKLWVGKDMGFKRVLCENENNLSGKSINVTIEKSSGMTLIGKAA